MPDNEDSGPETNRQRNHRQKPSKKLKPVSDNFFDDIRLSMLFSQVPIRRQKAFLAEVSTILSGDPFYYYQFHIETNHRGDCQREREEGEEVDNGYRA